MIDMSRFIPKVYTYALKSEETADLAQYLSFLSADVLGVSTNEHSDKNSARIIMAVKKVLRDKRYLEILRSIIYLSLNSTTM